MRLTPGLRVREEFSGREIWASAMTRRWAWVLGTLLAEWGLNEGVGCCKRLQPLT
jgi:hypothetical protein